MRIDSDRFGILEVPDNKVIKMKKPILGFENLTRYVLVEQDDFQPFLWLQAVDNPAVAFIVVNPVLFCADYRIAIHSKEVADLRITSVQNVEIYVIITVPKKIEDMSLNLQGPILINAKNRLAKQLVLVNSDYRIRQPLLELIDASRTGEPEPAAQLVSV